MTGNSRKDYSDAQNVSLVAQVDSVCPLCDKPLFYKKNKISYKEYDIAHIYPLNPSEAEIDLLKNEERLGDGDANHEDNVIPLCKSCHGKYDKPRTIDEYNILLEIKKQLIERSGQEYLWSIYSIEEDIFEIIEKLYSENPDISDLEIDYDPKTINEKLNDTISLLTSKKIKNNVSCYYSWFRSQMENLDKSNPDVSQLISLQIKGFYIKQKQRGISQQAIFENIVSWIHQKTRPKSIEAAEIVTSFFVQNCEVFE